jgi:hypothetical protein
MMHVISLGAGVQSTTMALMAAHGEITPMPDCAIFADTGWEPKAVYDHLAWLQSPNVLPFPVHVVSIGNIKDDLIARSNAQAKRFITIPAYLLTENGKEGISRRQCTSHYKIEPMRKKVRELLGRPIGPVPKSSVTKWLGISLDEIIRATPSRIKFEVHRFPLLELQMARRDCLKWLEIHGYPTPPKSACIGCPFHDDRAWRDMKDNRPEEWAEAVEIDKTIRKPIDRRHVEPLRAEQFLHPQRVPLDKVDLSTPEDHGQLNLFNNECEGMCGV